MITYVIEQLYHFQCSECNKWFSIADYHVVKESVITCPHCSHKTTPLCKNAVVRKAEQLEAQIPQWMNSKEVGFPPIRLQVLISDGKNIAHARRVNAYDNHFEICASNDRVNANDVKFWMPLPKAPDVKP